DEIEYIEDNIRLTYLYRANSAFRDRKFQEALRYFNLLDSLEPGRSGITHNLALLYHELGYTQKAVVEYEKLIETAPAIQYYLALSNLYEMAGEERKLIELLKQGSTRFPENRDLVFKLLNHLGVRNSYEEIV